MHRFSQKCPSSETGELYPQMLLQERALEEASLNLYQLEGDPEIM